MEAYIFVRRGELRKAEWSEIDFETATWKIPSQKMKMKKPHIVPLATQVMEILLLRWIIFENLNSCILE
ncbi:MAG: tyrosine-type recombinase/integrase [Deltaproteobacteria bacterium]|jgi:integrase|nr:tyrosine-type recombinase/integrase [Deltaproteobacteria bacterium]